ncbi:ESPR-type extended signal peptide-containing protein, partial [Negativicoccus succinicivorans]|uniref:ESPR-type extended signal peptide-containing protein n=1 Tax=Negativicoccus succinicivorans TaxID=620903 RepID=UPI0028FF04A0
MNKIYKIVWSKAAEAYVVTSELAKSHTKSPSGKGLRRSVTAALLATMVAAPVAFGVYAAGDTHYVSVNSDNQSADSNYDNQGAQAKNSIAIGPSVKTTGEDNIIIGSGEIDGTKGETSFNGTRVLVVGHGNYFQPTSEWDDNTKGKSILYRDVAIVGHSNKLLQGNKADAGKGYPTHQLVHGWKNTLNGSYTGAIGYENEIKNNSREGYTSHHMAFAIGSANTIDATGYYMGDKNRINTLADYTEPIHPDEAYGADLYVIGRHNIVGSNKDKESYVNKGRIIGSENVVYSNDVNVFGKFNKAYGSSALVVGTVNRVGVDKEGNLIKTDEGGELTSPVAVGVNNVVTAPYGVAVGAEARAEGYRATAVGSLAVAPNDHSTAMGSENRATGYSSVAVGAYNNSYDFAANERKSYDSGMYSNAIGVMNISTAEASSAIGAKNTASGKQSSSFGYRNTAAGMNSSAVGYYNKAQGDKTSALGYFNQVTGKQSSAVGMQNYLTVAGSTAIGNYNNTWNVPEKKWEYQTAGAESAAIGIKNHSAGNYSSALGSQNKSGGTASSAVGYRNITDADLAAALGYANQATAGYGSAIGTRNVASGYQSSAVGNQNQAEGRNSQAVGYRNFVSGYGAVALGSENNLNFVKQYQALGFVQTGELSSALGISNTTAGRKSMGIGNSNYALGTKSVGVGLNNYSTGYQTLAMGHYAIAGSEDLDKIDQVKYAAAIGNRAKSTITDAVAIGSFSNTTRDKGDYGYNPVLEKAVTDTDITDDANIGTYRTELENARAEWQTSMEKAENLLHKIHTQQYADEAEYQQWSAEYDRLNADADTKMAAYDAAQKKVSDLVGAWQGQMAALSVGDEATGRTRQITGVAAGSADTDAVNVAQLKVLGGKVTANADDIATLKEGWTLADAAGSTKVVKAKDTVKVTGDEYITATVDNDGLKLGMDETKLNSQINNQIDNSKTVQAKMTSWVLKAATTDKDPAAKGQTIDNDNKVVTFGVEKEDQGLTVARDGASIKYGIDGSKIDIAGNTSITNLNNKIEKSKIHYFSVKADDSKKPAGTNWNNDGATGENAIAIGKDAKAEKKASVVVGLKASSGGAANDGVAVGNTASVTGFSGVAIGRESSAQGQETVAIGAGAKGNLNQTIAIGGYANADGFGAVSIGRSSSSKERGVSVGTQSFSNLRSVAVGEQANAESKYSVAVGDQTASYAEAGVTLGNKTRVYGDSSVAIGNQARVSGKPLTEAEYNALPDAEKSSYKVQIARYPNPADPMHPTIEKTYFKVFNATDWHAQKHYNSIAIGTTSFVEAKEAIGIGAATRIHGDRGVALGYAAVSEENGTALGAGAQAKANAGVALGEGAVADTAAEVAGYDPQTGKASTETTSTWKSVKGAVSVGTADATRQITNLAAGLADTDAVNVAQLKVVNAKADKNATDITNLTKTVNANGKATKVMVDGQEDRTDGNLKIKKTDTDGQLTYDL